MGKLKDSRYAEAVISVQAFGVFQGKPAHILVRDPVRPDGYQWVGGYYRATGSMEDAARDVFKRETGMDVMITGLHQIVFSRTKRSGKWIANHAFGGVVADCAARDEPAKEYRNQRNFELALFDSHTLGQQSPKKIATLAGTPYDQPFSWSTTDGEFLSQIAKNAFFPVLMKNRPSWYFSIPTVDIPAFAPVPEFLSSGLTIGSAIIPHMYKGKPGYVLARNTDAPDKDALFGGKIEQLRSRESENIDSVSGILAEAMEEGNFALKPLSIIGVAQTPLQSSNRDEYNSLVNCCLLAGPLNPLHLDEILDNPQRHITEKDKIADIVFRTHDELEQIVQSGLMRTKDMAKLVARFLEQSPADRPNLEHVSVLANHHNR